MTWEQRRFKVDALMTRGRLTKAWKVRDIHVRLKYSASFDENLASDSERWRRVEPNYQRAFLFSRRLGISRRSDLATRDTTDVAFCTMSLRPSDTTPCIFRTP